MISKKSQSRHKRAKKDDSSSHKTDTKQQHSNSSHKSHKSQIQQQFTFAFNRGQSENSSSNFSNEKSPEFKGGSKRKQER